MKRRGVTIGPGAPSLLLVVVVIAMSVLGLLALMSARSDAQLTRRSLEYTVAEYERAAQAERSLAQLDGACWRHAPARRTILRRCHAGFRRA